MAHRPRQTPTSARLSPGTVIAILLIAIIVFLLTSAVLATSLLMAKILCAILDEKIFVFTVSAVVAIVAGALLLQREERRRTRGAARRARVLSAREVRRGADTETAPPAESVPATSA